MQFDVAAPIRQLAEKQKNVSVVLAEVTGVDLKSRTVEAHCEDLGSRKISFDYLVVAAGMQPSYFGHNEFARHAPGLKTLTDAEEIRTKILRAYEMAELTKLEEVVLHATVTGPRGCLMACYSSTNVMLKLADHEFQIVNKCFLPNLQSKQCARTSQALLSIPPVCRLP